MKNTLHIKLSKNLRYKDSTVSEAEIKYQGLKTQDELIEEMYNEGVCTDKNELKKIITAYNQKTASYVLKGFTVKTGLIKISATIRGLIHNKKWNQNLNRIEIKTECDKLLASAIEQCSVEFEDSKRENTDDVSTALDDGYDNFNENIFLNNETPACGIVFRQWLWKSI